MMNQVNNNCTPIQMRLETASVLVNKAINLINQKECENRGFAF